MKRTVYGIGIYDSSEPVLGNKCYDCWRSMIRRCYGTKELKRNPTYEGTTVAEEWLVYSVFKAWYDEHYVEGFQLDKDLIVAGNKVYSKEVCIFVPPWLNSFTTDSAKARGDLPIGVTVSGSKRPYKARCNNPITGKRDEYLGIFYTPEEAHQAWREKKISHVVALREQLDEIDDRIYPSLLERYSR